MGATNKKKELVKRESVVLPYGGWVELFLGAEGRKSILTKKREKSQANNVCWKKGL